MVKFLYMKLFLTLTAILGFALCAFAQTTYVVSNGDELRAALRAPVRGDIIILQAGATFVGPFTLPPTSGNGWVTLQSSASANLPAAGVRVNPKAHAAYMPKLVPGGGTVPIIATGQGASHYQFIGLEITTDEIPDISVDDRFLDHLVRLGQETELAISDLPHHFIFERCYIHGSPTKGSRRG